MSKEILLAKSNFKRKKSATITIGLLILLSTLLLGLSLLLMLDVYPNTERYAKKLDAGDGIAILYKDIKSSTYVLSKFYQSSQIFCNKKRG